MIFYVIRHKASGELMPELKRTRGYSHWNPSTGSSPHHSKLLGVPRLFPNIRTARRCIVQWNSMPNARMTYGHDGEVDIDIRDDGRKAEDLEVVEINIEYMEEL